MKLLAFLTIVFSVFFTLAFAKTDVPNPLGYSLGPGDVVKITVYDHPDLSIDAEIANDGSLNMPLIGNVDVNGLNFKQVESKIGNSLVKGGYLQNASVNVLITQYKSKLVSVIGSINQPGRYPLINNPTVLDLIAQAGGISPDGGSEIKLINLGGIKIFNLNDESFNQLNTTKVSAGDTIVIPKKKVIYVYGEVARPGMYELTKDMTIMQSIAVAGGFTGKADRDDISIQHSDKKQKVKDLLFKLSENDVVFVDESLF